MVVDTSTQSRTAELGGEDSRTLDESWAILRVIFPRETHGCCPVGRELTVGRDPGPQGLKTRHTTVSRAHLRFRNESGTVSVHDLGSRNGSWVNGSPLRTVPRVLRSGDVVRFGLVVAVFEQGHESIPEVHREPTAAVLGTSSAACRLRAAIANAAPDPSAVLITGESGVGKESVAQELHRQSERTGPMVVANCAALSATLIDSQLFGHERGAFTGAIRPQAGLFRTAHGGSLFLDEIGEMPMSLQAKLLRAVERGEVVPLGTTQMHVVDTRVIAATNRNIAQEVDAGRFRGDLCARLSLFQISVPPLRARKPDILEWTDALWARWSAKRGRPPEPLEFTGEAVEALVLHDWPENLRGIDRLVHAIGTTSSGERITREQLAKWGIKPMEFRPAATTTSSATTSSLSPPLPAKPGIPTREQLVEALEHHEWNIQAVANQFERSRRQIYRWMDALEIRR